MSLNVGLIGLGAIGQSVVEQLIQHADGSVQVVSALLRNPGTRRPVGVAHLVTTLDELLEQRPGIVVEVAGHAALREYGPTILHAGYDLMIVSVGALADRTFEDDMRSAARQGGSQLRIASGGIGALDVIGAARIGGLHSVAHTTRKPARSLLPPEEAAQIADPKVIFVGSAREGALLFPESANVAAAVSLAGVGFDRTQLQIVADPTITRNLHHIAVDGYFGSMRFEIENVPSEHNPKSARLAAMSVTHALLNRRAAVIVG